MQPVKIIPQNVDRLLDTNKVWSTVFWSDATCETYTFRYKLTGDTIVNDLNYYKVVRNYNEETPINWDLIGFIRYDTANRVLFKRLNALDEYLLYDYYRIVKDTFQIMCFAGGYPHKQIEVTLDSVGTFSICNKSRKTYHLSYVKDNDDRETWIEGIGSLRGFLTNFYPPDYDGLGGYELLCFEENDTVKYINPDYNTCFYTTVEYNELNEYDPPQVILFPNPVEHKSKLVLTGVELNEPFLEIFDISGRKIESRFFNNNFIEINADIFKKGTYIYRIYDKKKLICTGKFIINH